MGIGTSTHPDPDKTSRALGKELDVKPKHGVEVCRAIRGRTLSEAKVVLEQAIDKKKAIPFRRHVRFLAHQKGVGPGAFPVKACGEILKLLNHAESNAEYKGLDTERLWVLHAATHGAGFMPGSIPRARGSATPFNKSLSHIEVVLEEREDTTRTASEVKAKAKAEAKAEVEAEAKKKQKAKTQKAGERAREKQSKRKAAPKDKKEE